MKVTGLHRYPVKSLRGTSLTHATVERLGLHGDRRWLVVDANDKFQTIREHPVMTQIEATLRDDGGLVLSHPSMAASRSIFRWQQRRVPCRFGATRSRLRPQFPAPVSSCQRFWKCRLSWSTWPGQMPALWTKASANPVTPPVLLMAFRCC
jgi:hypothetical protein